MLDNFKVGNSFELQKVFSKKNIEDFAILTGDINPVHLDNEFAQKLGFEKQIVHGIFVASLFSTIIANYLPGPGSVYLHQKIDFKSPIYCEQLVIAKVEIISLRNDKPILELKTTCIDENNKILVDGAALILKKQI